MLAALDEDLADVQRLAPHARRWAILLSETSPNKFNAPLVDWCDEHDAHLFHKSSVPGGDECAIISSEPFAETAVHRLTNLKLTKATTNRTAPIELCSARVKGGPWLNMWHSPAHNDGLNPQRWPTRVYLDALRGLHAVRLNEHGAGSVLAGDWNIDLSRAAVRAQLAKPYPRMRWSYSAGQHPTEGGRVIDGFLTNLPLVQPGRTLRLRDGFDHRPVFAELGEHKRAA